MDQAQCSGVSLMPSKNGLQVRARDEITARFDLYNPKQVTIVVHEPFNILQFSLEELEDVVRYAKTERVKQRKEYEQLAKSNLKHIQSL